MIAIEVADGVAGGGDARQALLQPPRIDPDLERREAFLAEPQGGLGALGRGEQRPARGVGRDAVRRAAEQGRDRQSGDLAEQVPQGRLERPVAAGVEVDGLEDAHVAGDGERVLADEQMLERLEPVHRVARPDAGHALVGLDPDDGRRERPCAGPGPRPPGTADRAAGRAVPDGCR